MISGKRIFVTGGAGFIANALIARLIGENDIVVYDNFHRDTLSASASAARERLQVVRGDVLDFHGLYEAMRSADIVVHAAAIAGIDTVIKSPTRTMRVNMLGTANALEAAHILGSFSLRGMDAPRLQRFIDFSTSEVFGSMAFKPTEDSDTVAGSAGEARWCYAVSKLAGEHLAHAYHREFGLPTVSVRPFNVYGPGQTGEGALKVFIERALRGANIEIYGDGNQIRAWCYIEDFVDALLLCMEHPSAVGESFNIGDARAVLTTYGLAQTVCRVLKSDSKIVFRPALSAEVELRIPSVAKAERLLGFKASVDLDEGILKTAEWLRSRA